VELMPIVQPQEAELCVNAVLVTLEILSQSVDSNPVPPALVALMLTVLVLADLLSVNVDPGTLVIPTLTACLTPVLATLAVKQPFVRIMVEQPYVNVPPAM